MGLEYTELLMSCEQEFHMDIDFEKNHLDTVGSLYFYILKTLEQNGHLCPKVPAFFRLRNALLRHTSHDKRAIRPETRLVDLLPARGRRRIWRAIKDSTDLNLPPLRPLLPGWLVFSLSLMLGIPAAIILSIQLSHLIKNVIQTPLSETVAIIISGLFVILVFGVPCLLAAVLRLPAYMPKKWTMAVVVDTVVSERPGPIALDGKQWDPRSVWICLRDHIVKSLDVPPEQVTPDAHFFKDLRAG